MEVKSLMETLLKVEAVVHALADTLVVMVLDTLTKHLQEWMPRH